MGALEMPYATKGFDGRFDLAGWYLCRAVVRLKSTLGRRSPTLVDLGMGRGRDLIYLARTGFHVTGVDVSPIEIERARRRAARLGVPIRTEVGDLRTYRPRGSFDVVFSSTALNYLPQSIRVNRFAVFKRMTPPGGIHAVNAFVHPPHDVPPPDVDPAVMYFRSHELVHYYRGWTVLDSRELVLDCGFGERPHHHVVDVVIARRPPSPGPLAPDGAP